jgi:signal transduction histidine kinase
MTPAEHENMITYLSLWTGQDKNLISLLILHPMTGRVIAATNASDAGTFKEDRPYFVHGKEGAYVQNIYYSLSLGAPAITISAPIKSTDGRLLGVLAGYLNLDKMDEIINRRTGLRQTAESYLVNSSHLFVTQPRLVTDPVILQRGIYSEPVNRCLEQGSGVIQADDYRGIPVIALYRWLPGQDVCLITEIDQAEALASSLAFGKSILVFSAFTLLAALLLGSWLAHSLTKPIRQLLHGTEEIGRGNLDHRIEFRSRDEFGSLAEGFNRMGVSLKTQADLLRQRADQLESSNKELEAFSYTVSHDLRTPLRAIDGFSRILLDEYTAQLVSEGQRYLQLIRQSTQQMGHLIDDLLAFSRLGRQTITIEQVSPLAIVSRTLEELHAEQDGRKIDLVVGDLPECRADPALLKQVYLNLLSNALKFTRRRKIARIEVGAQHIDGQSVYFVRDNGVGFDMKYIDKLFGVFQRLHRSEEYEGTGVGLAIVQRIIQHHGGRVWAEAQLDKGAVFYFTLEGGISNG